MWDQPILNSAISDPFRIIPTYVGSTRGGWTFSGSMANHSHVCGINVLFCSVTKSLCESFPRMWDQRSQRGRAWFPSRIIPTYVGSTSGRISWRARSANHSHVCGINSEEEINQAIKDESFPRMWDQRVHRRPDDAARRIIPTYVGSTQASVVLSGHSANHSHVCGINRKKYFSGNSCSESFPRMWDQRLRVAMSAVPSRIIPTYVGSTCGRYTARSNIPNHSHVCGINLADLVM